MSYCITYPWEGEKKLVRKQGHWQGLIPGVLLPAAVLTLRLFVPQFDKILTGLLHPLMDQETMEAAGTLVSDVMTGIPVGEAVSVFCLTILGNG